MHAIDLKLKTEKYLLKFPLKLLYYKTSSKNL